METKNYKNKEWVKSWDNKQDSVLTGCCFTALYMLLSGKRKDVLFMPNCLG